MAVEEEHGDYLQNIESAIIQVYRANLDLIDSEVATALDALVYRYGAQAQGKTVSGRPVRGIAKEVMTAVEQVCEWRMGRSPEGLEDWPEVGIDLPPESLEVTIACLKRLQSSVKFWTQKNGRQGYLDFVGGFV
jgi:hypothetical protein